MTEKKRQTYRQAIAELEEIAEKIQQSDCKIDELKQYTSRSLELLRFCKKKLYETDEELKKMFEEIESQNLN